MDFLQDEGAGEICHMVSQPPSCLAASSNNQNLPSETSKKDGQWCTVLSALYCKLTVVCGVALPITQITSKDFNRNLYHALYIYLYGGSLFLISTLYLISWSSTALTRLTRRQGQHNRSSRNKREEKYKGFRRRINSHGGVYLRLGATAFGIGSMVYSGLEIAEQFLQGDCSDGIQITISILRMIFSVTQLHFIFLKEIKMDIAKYHVVLRFCFVHMLATDLCEWLSIIIEETKHEFHHLKHEHLTHLFNTTDLTTNKSQLENCTDYSSGFLIREASSYLFPCTIEYSLISAVTLVQMWKDIHQYHPDNSDFQEGEKSHHYTLDCSNSQRGFVCGLVFNVYTLITLILFFSLRSDPQSEATASKLIVLCETLILLSSLIAMLTASIRMRHLHFSLHRLNSKGNMRLCLDLTLLLKAQTGVYMYSIFSALASAHSEDGWIWPELLAIFQSTAQTIFILSVWWKRCSSKKDLDEKPGREMITLLRLLNMSLWGVSISQKNRAGLQPIQMEFFGPWAWLIITHVSMPLAIFYRFHSTICFFEIWHNAYKSTGANA